MHYELDHEIAGVRPDPKLVDDRLGPHEVRRSVQRVCRMAQDDNRLPRTADDGDIDGPDRLRR